MTTNVFDKAAGLLSTDSRWSVTLPGHAIIYVDDAPFEKIVVDTRLAFMFAGSSVKIQEWKSWIANPNRVVLNRPQVEGKGLALCLIDMDAGDVVFERNQEITSPEARFAGTGSWAAHGCWTKNKNARKAVESAKMADRLSGGVVKFLVLKSREHNLLQPDEFDSIRQGISTRGMVMYFQNPAHVPLVTAAATDPAVADAATKISNGEVTMTAPSASAENEWTEADVQRLDSVLAAYFPAA